jgi:predicted dienelactone hydrolase
MNTTWSSRALRAQILLSVAGALAAQSPETKAAAAEMPADLYKATAGPFAVEVIDRPWRDESRKRDISVRIYLPKTEGDAKGDAPKTKRPLVVMSHGLGGSCTTYPYFGHHLASHGYIVIAPTHVGSDTQSFMDWARDHRDEAPRAGGGWLLASISDPANLRDRPLDVTFVIDEAARNDLLKDLVDMERIGVAGHSFGAYTAMAIGGMTMDLPEGKARSLRDPRVKAVLPMSPEGPGTMGITAGSWDAFAVPVLFLTGTRDYGAGGRSAAWRRAGFEHVRGVDDYLVTLEGAGHMTFADLGGAAKYQAEDGARARLRERIRDPILEAAGGNDSADAAAHGRHVALIQALSTAFFDAYVGGDAKAKDWLAAFAAAKRGDCQAEFKPGKAAATGNAEPGK